MRIFIFLFLSFGIHCVFFFVFIPQTLQKVQKIPASVAIEQVVLVQTSARQAQVKNKPAQRENKAIASRKSRFPSRPDEERTDSFSPEQEERPTGGKVLGWYRPKPPYPKEAQREGLGGRVIVKIRTGSDGQVIERVLHTSSGHSLLDQSVLETVKKWKLDGERTVVIPFIFQIQANSTQ